MSAQDKWLDKILSSEATLSLLQQYIEYDSLEEFLNIMKTVKIFDLHQERVEEIPFNELYVSDLLLDVLLDICKKNNRENFVKPILNIWDSTELMYFQQPIFVRLFMYTYFSLDILIFVARSMKDEWSYNDILRKLIKLDSSPEVELAANRANKVYGIQSYQDYITLAEWADLEIEEDGWGNDRMNWFIQDMIKSTKPFKVTPKYIISTDKNPYGGNFMKMINNLPDTYNVIPSDVSSNDVIESSTYNISEDDRELYYQITDSMRYRHLINPNDLHRFKVGRARKSASLDMLTRNDIFKLLGPTNKYITSKLDENHPCDRYGGCRMLVCDQFEIKPYDSTESQVEIYDIISDYEYTYDPNNAPNSKLKTKAVIRKHTGSWFTGACYYCMGRIKKLEYSAREPLVDGGWRRCYCSWNCVRKKLLTDPESKERDIQYYLAVNFARQCKYIGIYERLK